MLVSVKFRGPLASGELPGLPSLRITWRRPDPAPVYRSVEHPPLPACHGVRSL